MNAIFAVFSIPIVILNLLGGISSGIWLAILGEWEIIGIGIAALFITSFAIPLVLAPSILLVMPGMYFYDKARFLYYIFILLANLYIVTVITVWCFGVLYYFIGRVTSDNYIPVLIWSYGMATGPITWMASKEQDSPASIIMAVFTQIGYILMIIAALFLTTYLFDLIVIFSIAMLMCLFFMYKAGLDASREARAVD